MKIHFRPEKEGLKTSLFDLEADIMEVVWSNDWREFVVADAHEALQKSRDIAYTTVMTTVHRLYEKELLARRRDGKRHVYSVRMSRDGFLKAMAREVLNGLPAVGQEEAVALLVDRVSEADVAALDRLEALIQERRRAIKP